MTDVSVVIPAYNAAPYLGAAIESALEQEGVRTEVVIIDDGSTDGTPDVLNQFAGRVRAIRQHNQGVSAARNAGMAAASHATLAFLDADDVWLRDKLHAQCALLDAGFEAVGCGMFLTDAELNVIDLVEAPACHLLELVHKKGNAGLNCSTVVARRSLIQRIGGFCQRLSTSADWDFAVRLLESGRVTSVRAPLVYYRQHAAAMHLNVGLMERDMKLAYERLRARQPAGVSAHDIEHGYSRLWRILAGSYWQQGAIFHAVRCGLHSMIAQPAHAASLAAHAWRVVHRR